MLHGSFPLGSQAVDGEADDDGKEVGPSFFLVSRLMTIEAEKGIVKDVFGLTFVTEIGIG